MFVTQRNVSISGHTYERMRTLGISYTMVAETLDAPPDRVRHLPLSNHLSYFCEFNGRTIRVMTTLDDCHFKSINDQFGHVTGDQVLARAAAVFGNQLRPYDLAARYGGEEFILLLPGISIDDAIAIAERIRKEVAEIKVAGCPKQITVSLGVASWITGEAPETLVARADAALYSAKRTGRNRVEAATGLRVQESSK